MPRSTEVVGTYVKLALFLFLLTELLFHSNQFVIYQFLALVGLLEFLRMRPLPGNDEKVREWLAAVYSDTLKQPFISHRGENPDAPNNTICAFKLALDRGANALEFDLHLSKDGRIVLIHDPIVDTTTDGHGMVKDMTVAELKKLNVNRGTSAESSACNDKECRIPTLTEVLDVLYIGTNNKYARTRAIFDVKTQSTQMAEEIVRRFRHYPVLYDNVVVAGLNPLLLYKIRKMDPAIQIGLTMRADYWTNKIKPDANNWLVMMLCAALDSLTLWAHETITWVILSNSFCLLHQDLMSNLVVTRWRKRGVEPIFWTLNDKTDKMYCSNKKGLNCAFISDHTYLDHPL